MLRRIYSTTTRSQPAKRRTRSSLHPGSIQPRPAANPQRRQESNPRCADLFNHDPQPTRNLPGDVRMMITIYSTTTRSQPATSAEGRLGKESIYSTTTRSQPATFRHELPDQRLIYSTTTRSQPATRAGVEPAADAIYSTTTRSQLATVITCTS
jgi:hypothetical protein